MSSVAGKYYIYPPVFIVCIILLIILMPSISGAATNFAAIDPATMITNAMTIFREAATEAGKYVVEPAQRLMYTLIVLDMTWTGINWILAPTDLDLQTIVGTYVKKIMYFSLIIMLVQLMGKAITEDNNILSNKSWLNTIPNSFAAFGDSVVEESKEASAITTGSQILSGLTMNFDNLTGGLNSDKSIGDPGTLQANPANILNGGVILALFFLVKIMVSFLNPGLLLPFNYMVNAFLFIFALGVAFMIVMEFSLLAIDMMINFIECYIVMAASIFIIGMSVTRWTAANISTYVAYLLSLGMRIVINMVLFTVGVIILTNVIKETGNPGIVPFKGTWELIIYTFGTMFFLAMFFKAGPNIATGFLTNTPMAAAGDGLKAGVSAFKSAMQGATSSTGIVGGAMASGGKAIQGKALFKDKATGEEVKLSKSALMGVAKGQVERIAPPPGDHSGVKKDMKKTWANMKFSEGSRTRDAVSAVKQGYKDAKRGDASGGAIKAGLKSGAKTLAGINSDAHTKGQKSTAVKNLVGKQLTGAGHLVKGAGKFMGSKGTGGKFLGKTLGALEKAAPADSPSPNILATINFDVQN